jgi:hypothetical protein
VFLSCVVKSESFCRKWSSRFILGCSEALKRPQRTPLDDYSGNTDFDDHCMESMDGDLPEAAFVAGYAKTPHSNYIEKHCKQLQRIGSAFLKSIKY